LTVIKVLMDFTMNKLLVSLAGHPRPLLIRPDGSSEWVGEEGLLIGQFDVGPDGDYGFVDTTIWLEEGEILLVYSDGLMDQKNRDGVMFSEIIKEKMMPKLAGKDPNEAYSLLEAELESHISGAVYGDDISFTFFGARPYSQYETCQYLFLDSGSNSSTKVELSGVMVRGVNCNGDALEDVYRPELVYCRILDALRSDNWHEERISDIKYAMDEVLTTIVEDEAEPSSLKLFSESQGRILVSINPKKKREFEIMFKNTATAHIGKVTPRTKIVFRSDTRTKVAEVTVASALRAYRSQFKNY